MTIPSQLLVIWYTLLLPYFNQYVNRQTAVQGRVNALLSMIRNAQVPNDSVKLFLLDVLRPGGIPLDAGTVMQVLPAVIQNRQGLITELPDDVRQFLPGGAGGFVGAAMNVGANIVNNWR